MADTVWASLQIKWFDWFSTDIGLHIVIIKDAIDSQYWIHFTVLHWERLHKWKMKKIEGELKKTWKDGVKKTNKTLHDDEEVIWDLISWKQHWKQTN